MPRINDSQKFKTQMVNKDTGVLSIQLQNNPSVATPPFQVIVDITLNRTHMKNNEVKSLN